MTGALQPCAELGVCQRPFLGGEDGLELGADPTRAVEERGEREDLP